MAHGRDEYQDFTERVSLVPPSGVLQGKAHELSDQMAFFDTADFSAQTHRPIEEPVAEVKKGPGSYRLPDPMADAA